MSTQVLVQRDGIVNHKHEGIKTWHDPATKHGGNLHEEQKADKPENLADLADDKKAQYEEALGGKSFNYLWVQAVKARREAAGDGWSYGKRQNNRTPAEREETAEQLRELDRDMGQPEEEAKEEEKAGSRRR